MRHRFITALLLSIAFISLGIWLNWVLIVVVGLALLFVFALHFFLRPPKTALWWDISAPVRVSRGDHAQLTIGVSFGPGSTRWVSAVNTGQENRTFINPDSSNQLEWDIDTRRRGRFDVGPTTLEFAEPFGVYRKILAERTLTPVLVVPRIHSIPRTAFAHEALSESGSERAGGDTFESVREYVVGDPQKLVHWKATARAGKLMVRRMVDTTTPLTLVVLDINVKAYDRSGSQFDDFYPDAFEQSVETAASWVWHGCGAQERVLLTTTANSGSGAESAVEVTMRNRESALDWLAMVNPLPMQACGASRIDVLIQRHPASRIVVITGAQFALASPWINKWQRRVPVTTIVGHS